VPRIRGENVSQRGDAFFSLIEGVGGEASLEISFYLVGREGLFALELGEEVTVIVIALHQSLETGSREDLPQLTPVIVGNSVNSNQSPQLCCPHQRNSHWSAMSPKILRPDPSALPLSFLIFCCEFVSVVHHA
jgi:hypothetical protein